MLPTVGLYGHIRRNNIRTSMLLAGFVVLVGIMWAAVTLTFAAIGSQFDIVGLRIAAEIGEPTNRDLMLIVAERWSRIAVTYAYVPGVLVIVWFAIAWVFYGQMIRSATGAEPVSRIDHPKLYNMVENLAITAGLPVPRIEIMETDALNAYAAGLTPSTATVAVTRGLLDRLADDELEAVLAHEMTHIRNYDVRVMVVASIFVGVLGFVSALMWRHATDGRGIARAGNGAGIVAVIIAVAVAAIASFFGTLTRLAISRSREYMADAGAVELTKNPDAMIRALQRIAGHDEIEDLPEEMQAMMISSRFDGLFSTHPVTEDRIAALEAYAGGRRGELTPRPARIGAAQRTSSPAAAAAPAAAPAFGRLGMKSGAGPAAPARPGPAPSVPVRPGASTGFGRRTARPNQARA